jgi:serine/threonine protein phosphatase 1
MEKYFKMKRFVIGDIHGAYKALLQCLERSKFDYENDELIVLGDVVDGWNEVPQCIEELLKIKNLIYILGNHDWWTVQWFKLGYSNPVWELNGGQATKDAYIAQGDLLVKHRDFFDKANVAYEDNNILFVHGGLIYTNQPLEKQNSDNLMWDRSMFKNASIKHYQKSDYKYGGYEKIFIGHTATVGANDDKPIKRCNVWNLDQGAGWNGKLTIMNVDTEEYWQSDNVLELYPNVRGRF